MKPFYFFSALLLIVNIRLQAQEEFISKTKNVDDVVKTMKLGSIRDLDVLADTLTSSFKTDSEKVRAIYYWLAENIAYDWNYYKKVQSLSTIHLPKGMDYEDWKFMRMEKTIAKKKGICGDYAELFSYLCRRSGIQATVISGYAATHRVSILMVLDQEETNHAWNAVNINGKWRLVDVCWASGLMQKGRHKISRPRNDFYYLTPPGELIKNHRPLLACWQLLNTPMSMRNYIRVANEKIKNESSWYSYWTPF